LTASSDEEVNRLVAEVQLLEATINALNSRLELTEAALNESRMALETLKAIKDAKKGDSILVPIGADSYIFAKVDSTEKVIVGVGANVRVEKSIESSIEMVDQRINRLEQIRKALEQQLLQASQRLGEARERLERLIRAREVGSPAGRS